MSQIKSALKRALLLPERVRDLETRTDLHDDILEHCGDDIVKLEERMDMLEARQARMEWAAGVVFCQKEAES